MHLIEIHLIQLGYLKNLFVMNTVYIIIIHKNHQTNPIIINLNSLNSPLLDIDLTLEKRLNLIIAHKWVKLQQYNLQDSRV